MELFNVLSLTAGLALLRENFGRYSLTTEKIPTCKAVGKVLSSSIKAVDNVPHFRRSVVDGYAVRCADLIGASESLPALLTVIGEVVMGKPAEHYTHPGQAVYVPTGGMVPEGADAMVMIEYTEKIDEEQVAIYRPISKKENIMAIGDDILAGEVVFERGQLLRAQDIGVLTAIGCVEVEIYQKPKVAVFSTGDELISPASPLETGKIRDINTYTITAYLEQCGVHVTTQQVIGDDYQLLLQSIKNALLSNDLVLISGGSSVGNRDYTREVMENLGPPGVIMHGLALKPGKPTLVANINDKAVIGLPGQPVSALVVLEMFVKPLLGLWQGIDVISKDGVTALLSESVHAAPGRMTIQMVKLSTQQNRLYARPIRGKSGMISLLSRADGYIIIEENNEGVNIGDEVIVYRL